MRAIVVDDYGTPPHLADHPTPEAGSGEVLVRVHAASVNGFDLAVAAGYVKGMLEHTFPAVLGKDFAGSVAAVGDDVGDFAVGDRVFGVVMKMYIRHGSFAEFVAVPTAIGIAGLPDEVDFATAGALGLAGTTAMQAIAALNLGSGETVLIAGATGGVGSFAVQFAAASGATVIATASSSDEKEHVRSLGADQTVDYKGDVPAAIRAMYPAGVDAAVHLAGDGAMIAGLVRTGGRFASTLGFAPDDAEQRELAAVAVMGSPDADTLRRLADLVASGKLRVPVEARYPLEAVPAAFAHFTAGTLGKLGIAVS